MTNAMTTFNALVEQNSISEGLFNYLSTERIPIDPSDLLRWQWVLSVSALDKYVHDVVRIGMVEAFEGKRDKTLKFQSFHIEMKKYSIISTSDVPVLEFEKEVIRQHSYLAFQYPDKIADALSYIWDEPNKWEVISRNMRTPMTSRELKIRLKTIILRRNQIVHEGDCLSSILPLQQQPISLSDTSDVCKFITEIVKAIDKSIT